MDIKTNMALLAEAAAIDANLNIVNEANVDAVRESYNSIPECVGITVTEAADVVVTPVAGDYFVEMTNLAPFLLDSGIRSVSKALDMVAEANGLEPKSVGLIIDSQDTVSRMLYESTAKARKTGNDKIRENAISKVSKNIAIAKRLMSEGYKVAKKRSDAKVCDKCGKAKGKCECDGANCSTGSAVIAEDDKTGKKIAEQVNESLAIIWGDKSEYQNLSESQLMAVLETKIYKTKAEIKNAIKDIEKKPDAGDHIVSFFINWLKFALLNIGVGVASAIGGSTVGAIVGGSTGAAVGGSVAAGISATPIMLIIVFVTTLCCTKILHVAGSITDKKKQINKIIKAIDNSIPKAKKSGNDKLVNELTKAREKAEEKLKELNDTSAGRSRFYQNTRSESVENV